MPGIYMEVVTYFSNAGHLCRYIGSKRTSLGGVLYNGGVIKQNGVESAEMRAT